MRFTFAQSHFTKSDSTEPDSTVSDSRLRFHRFRFYRVRFLHHQIQIPMSYVTFQKRLSALLLRECVLSLFLKEAMSICTEQIALGRKSDTGTTFKIKHNLSRLWIVFQETI